MLQPFARVSGHETLRPVVERHGRIHPTDGKAEARDERDILGEKRVVVFTRRRTPRPGELPAGQFSRPG
jgi:hypothetical protein